MTVIDFRVRLPHDLRQHQELPVEYRDQYDRVLDLTNKTQRTLADLNADMDAAGVTHAVIHAEYETGDPADTLNEAVAKLVTENARRWSAMRRRLYTSRTLRHHSASHCRSVAEQGSS